MSSHNTVASTAFNAPRETVHQPLNVGTNNNWASSGIAHPRNSTFDPWRSCFINVSVSQVGVKLTWNCIRHTVTSIHHNATWYPEADCSAHQESQISILGAMPVCCRRVKVGPSQEPTSMCRTAQSSSRCQSCVPKQKSRPEIDAGGEPCTPSGQA